MSGTTTIRWDLLAFAAGLSVLSFVYGVLTTTFNIFPNSIIKSAISAAVALRQQRLAHTDRVHLIRSSHTAGGVIRHDPTGAYPGLTLLTLFTGERNIAVLVDMRGHELHRWDVVCSTVFGDEDHSVSDINRYLNSAHLFPNGDILLNFDYAGLVKLDKTSKVLWKLDEQTHHSLFVADDGFIWAPTRQLQQTRQAFAPKVAPPFYDDQILKISPEGKILKRISILKAISASGYEGILYANAWATPSVTSEDPLHLNDVEVVPGLNTKSRLFNTGDVLVSLRNLNALVTLNPDKERITWARTGPFLRQHDPDILPNGNLLVFDNRTDINQLREVRHLVDPPVFGYSRVVELEPAKGSVVWEFKGTLDQPFYSSINGMSDRLPNGNILVVEPEAGRVFEIGGTSRKDVVWEYVNSLGADHQLVGRLAFARRLDPRSLLFLDEPKS